MRRRGADCRSSDERGMPWSERGEVIAVERGTKGLYPGRSPKFRGRRQPSCR